MRMRLIVWAALGILACSGVGLAEEANPSVTAVDVSSLEQVEIAKLVKPGATTIVDVFSEACPPCRALSPKLDALTAKRSDLRVLKLDIGTIPSGKRRKINWGAPMLKTYGIRGIPYLFVYDEKGQEIAAGDAAREKVGGWLEEAGLDK